MAEPSSTGTTQTAEGIIKKLDKGLQAYYKTLNREYRVGKFEEFAKENDWNDIHVKEELYGEDYTLSEFDVNDNGESMFPLNVPIEDERSRNEEILSILRIIAEKGQYKPNPITSQQKNTKTNSDLLEMTVNITAKEIDETAAKYKEQMSCLHKHAQKDKGLQYFLGVSEKEKIPFITYMVDSYTNEKAKYFTDNNKATMSVKEWSNKSGFMKALRNKYPPKIGIADKLESAMNEYSTRIMARLQFSPTVQIKDDLKAICEYIASVPAFIHKIMDKQLGIPPFQIELLIAVKGVTKVNDDNKDNAVEDDEDDDDDDNDEKNKQKNQPKKQLDPEIDYIGHVQEQLEKYPVHYYPKDNWDIDETQQTIDATSRFLNERYVQFRTVLSEYHKHKDGDDQDENKDDDGNKDNNKFRRKFNAKTYPKNMRFSIFLDRREKKPTNQGDDAKNKENTDQVTYYQLPDFCNFIENDHVPEIGFELIRKCIIPSKENNITALDTVCGQLMTFMFNVEQQDEIRCYIVWNGQAMRFQGEHMLQVLPHLFHQNKENIQFIKEKQAINTIIKNFNDKTSDVHFDKFCKKLQSFNN